MTIKMSVVNSFALHGKKLVDIGKIGQIAKRSLQFQQSTKLFASNEDDSNNSDSGNEVSSQIARLNAEAAKLRAEAAELEAIQRKEDIEKITQVFRSFDTDASGSISVAELRKGLETALKASVSEEQAKKVLTAFDTSGDGELQLDEFPVQGIESFRNKLATILREEKRQAAVAEQEARVAKAKSDELDLIVEMINNRPPNVKDKVVSCLPYLLPVLDALPYGKSIITSAYADQSNFFMDSLAFLYQIYETIPFSGLILFYFFNVFSNNLKLNRLVRFNIQQAIFIDIALIIPGILGSLASALLQSTGGGFSPEVNTLASSITFYIVSAAVIYSLASTLLGQEPDKLPLISERVKKRVPTTSEFKDMIQKGLDEAEKQKDKKSGKGRD